MERYKRFFEGNDVFINSLNNYIQDNYSDKDIKIIQNFKSRIGIEKEKSLRLYRGIFLDNLSEKEINYYLNLKFIEDKNISYTRSYSEALAFASGSNIFNKTHSKLSSEQLGILLKVQIPVNDIIIDLNYALNSDEYEELDIIEENEVIVKIKSRQCKIIAFITDRGIKKIL